MRARTAKAIIGLRVGSIEKTARIHKDIFPSDVQFHREQIVVLMSSNPIRPGRVAVQQEEVPLMPQDVEATVGERPTPGPRRLWNREAKLAPSDPQPLDPTGSRGRTPLLTIKEDSGEAQQMAMIPHIAVTITGQDMQSAVVSIADLWGQSIRFRVARHKFAHPRQAVPKTRGQLDAVAPT
jgi:hypothetical protein